MKDHTTQDIRNVCLAGQRGSGKTSLADTIAFYAGINNRVGRVDDGSSLLDYTDSELARNTTITSKLLASEWNSSKINLFDCPGHADFVGEALSCMKVSDTIAFVINAASGVEIGTQLQWNLLKQFHLARLFFVNKMENENVTWQANLTSLTETFGHAVVPVQLPIGESAGFKGVVDLISMKAHTLDANGKTVAGDIPADMKDIAESQREKLVEIAAEGDDALMEKYFEDGALSDEDFKTGFRKSIASGSAFPVLCGSVNLSIGINLLLDFITDFCPSPDKMPPIQATTDTSAADKVVVAVDVAGKPLMYLFKTVAESHLGELSFFKLITGSIKSGVDLKNLSTGSGERVTQIYSMQGKNRIELTGLNAGDIGALVKLKSSHTGNTLAAAGVDLIIDPVKYPNPVMDVAMTSKSKGDEEKISTGLAKLGEEDPTFRLELDPALQQQVLYGQGPTHIEVLSEKLRNRFSVEVELTRPKIPYRETVRGKAEQQYRHKKQSGGRGQFGDVHIRIEPNGRGKGFEFLDEIKGGVIPGKFIPAVEKGIVESMLRGNLSGSPVVDVKVALYFGSYHDVDSSDMAFKIAGLMAFREGYMQAKPVILEPICNLEVTVPDDFTGDVMGDLSSRRGKIAGMDPDGRNQVIRATVPQAELYQYAVDLRSMTQGQGFYSLEFSHYEEVPHDTAQKIIEQTKREHEEAS
ncbi:MAG: elongation factor G [bacterium]